MPVRVPSNANRFKRLLLKWYRRAGRALPWRDTRDPYRILVSEFMLQQTQVSRVAEYYPRFLARFPTLSALARAAPKRVREAWDGLGYYRRAANLHRLARAVESAHGGTIPADPRRLRSLPGVGRYTAGAVAMFAFEKRSATVDTNVARVLARVFRPRVSSRPQRRSRRGRGPDRAAAPEPTGAARARTLWDLAERVLPARPRTAWEFNQALMDLGALYCRARRPRCEVCPVRTGCKTGAAPRGEV